MAEAVRKGTQKPEADKVTGVGTVEETHPETEDTGRTVGEASGAAGPLQSRANPEGRADVSTGDQGPQEVIAGAEHVLGDDPRRIVGSGFHDSLSGRPVDERGTFTDSATPGSEEQIPAHRIVADNWPQEREAINDPAKRPGNTTTQKAESRDDA